MQLSTAVLRLSTYKGTTQLTLQALDGPGNPHIFHLSDGGNQGLFTGDHSKMVSVGAVHVPNSFELRAARG